MENVGAVMTNILRTQGKMEDLTLKLQALKTAEATQLLAQDCVTPTVRAVWCMLISGSLC